MLYTKIQLNTNGRRKQTNLRNNCCEISAIYFALAVTSMLGFLSLSVFFLRMFNPCVLLLFVCAAQSLNDVVGGDDDDVIVNTVACCFSGFSALTA